MADNELWSSGVFPSRYIERLANGGAIVAPPFDPDQVQPASLDLRLGEVDYRIRASFLPGPDYTVAERTESRAVEPLSVAIFGAAEALGRWWLRTGELSAERTADLLIRTLEPGLGRTR